MRLYFPSLTLLSIFALASCIKSNEAEIMPKVMQIEIAGEGGESVVDLGAGDWQIARIVNNNEDLPIFGNTYTLSGEIIRRNQPLALDGLGRLASEGSYRGFLISHESSGTLTVVLQENGSGNPFSFLIVLKNGNETKEIVIDQGVSAGYSFVAIEYFLDDSDQDSIYVRNQVATYQFNFLAPKEVEISPFNGPDIVINSHFKSNDSDAFVWLARDSVEVSVPADLIDGDVLLSDHKKIYGGIANEPYRPDFMVTIHTPAGQSNFATDVEWRHRTLSYRLTMTSNRTDESKIIIGKWIEISPTGIFEIKRMD